MSARLEVVDAVDLWNGLTCSSAGYKNIDLVRTGYSFNTTCSFWSSSSGGIHRLPSPVERIIEAFIINNLHDRYAVDLCYSCFDPKAAFCDLGHLDLTGERWGLLQASMIWLVTYMIRDPFALYLLSLPSQGYFSIPNTFAFVYSEAAVDP